MNAIAFHSGISAVNCNQHCFTVYQAWIADSIDSGLYSDLWKGKVIAFPLIKAKF
jgi:hypothetical protein